MWEPKQFCCCSLRVGTMVLGWLGVIGAAFHLLSILRMSGVSHEDFVKICHNVSETQGQVIDDVTCANVAIGVIAFGGVMSGLNVIINILLLVGVQKNKPQLMRPYLIMQATGMVFFAVMIVATFGVFVYVGAGSAALLFVIFVSPIFGLMVYFFLVVRACYKEVTQFSLGMIGSSSVPYTEQRDVLFNEKI